MSHDYWLDETGIGWKRFRVSRGSKKAALEVLIVRSQEQIEFRFSCWDLLRPGPTVDAASLRERGSHDTTTP